MNLFWYWINGVSTYYDNPGQTLVIVNWTPTSTDGTYYSLGANDIHLAAANPDSDHTTIHEGARALPWTPVYNDDFPPAPNCSPHYVMGPASTGCAWTEGWAEWVRRALNDPFYRWDNGAFLDLELPAGPVARTRATPWRAGSPAPSPSICSDNANEAPWDRYGEAEAFGAEYEEIYATNIIQVSDTLDEYCLADRPGEGDTGYLARAAIFANPIDYTHRDPLTNNVEASTTDAERGA